MHDDEMKVKRRVQGRRKSTHSKEAALRVSTVLIRNRHATRSSCFSAPMKALLRVASCRTAVLLGRGIGRESANAAQGIINSRSSCWMPD